MAAKSFTAINTALRPPLAVKPIFAPVLKSIESRHTTKSFIINPLVAVLAVEAILW